MRSRGSNVVGLLRCRCGHCKQFAPTYEKIAQALKEGDPPVPVAKVDATKATGIASRFDVSGYPTIKVLKNGEAVDYDGDQTEAGKKKDTKLLSPICIWGEYT